MQGAGSGNAETGRGDARGRGEHAQQVDAALYLLAQKATSCAQSDGNMQSSKVDGSVGPMARAPSEMQSVENDGANTSQVGTCCADTPDT